MNINDRIALLLGRALIEREAALERATTAEAKLAEFTNGVESHTDEKPTRASRPEDRMRT